MGGKSVTRRLDFSDSSRAHTPHAMDSTGACRKTIFLMAWIVSLKTTTPAPVQSPMPQATRSTAASGSSVNVLALRCPGNQVILSEAMDWKLVFLSQRWRNTMAAARKRMMPKQHSITYDLRCSVPSALQEPSCPCLLDANTCFRGHIALM